MPATPAECLAAREWLSASRDGEAFDDAPARTHLRDCADCRAWENGLDVVTPRTRLRSAAAGPDVTSRALAVWAQRTATAAARQAAAGRVLLAVAGAAALLLAGLGAAGAGQTLSTAGQHLGWELHALEAALGVGFCFAAARPDAYARALLPVTAAAAVLTLHPFAVDLSRVAADPLSEATHVSTLAGLAALVLLLDVARRQGGSLPTRDRHASA